MGKKHNKSKKNKSKKNKNKRPYHEAEFRIGWKVRISGLKSNAKYNGTYGRICARFIFANKKYRYPVRMDLDGKEFNLKAENVESVRTVPCMSVWVKPGSIHNEARLYECLEPLFDFDIHDEEKNRKKFNWTSGVQNGQSLVGFDDESEDDDDLFFSWDDNFLPTQTEFNAAASVLYSQPQDTDKECSVLHSVVNGHCVIQRNWRKIGGDPEEEFKFISCKVIADLVKSRMESEYATVEFTDCSCDEECSCDACAEEQSASEEEEEKRQTVTSDS